MTTTDQTALASLTARIDERILAPLRRSGAARTWFYVTLAAILCLHAGFLVFLLHRDASAPQQIAQEATPVEVIVEKKEEPKPPEKKSEPPKPPAKKPEIEEAAHSAPRAPSDIKVDTAALDKETHAPKADKPLSDGKPQPAQESSSPSKESAQDEKVEEATTKPDVLEKDAEALSKAVPTPQPRPKELAKATPHPKSRALKTVLAQLAGASQLPDYKFARKTKKSPVYGGNEDSRYLSIVYGMIMQHRSRFSVPAGDSGSVTVAFNVDDEGNLVGMGIQQSSGYPEIDQAVAAAIRRASPFPPPPAGSPHGLIATIDFQDRTPIYSMGGGREE